MAEIDKSLPNVKQTINVPSPEEVQVDIQEQQQEQDSPIDIQPNEDGSVDINFDPSVGSQEQGEDHFANLAELLPEEVLGPIGHDLYENSIDCHSVLKIVLSSDATLAVKDIRELINEIAIIISNDPDLTNHTADNSNCGMASNVASNKPKYL